MSFVIKEWESTQPLRKSEGWQFCRDGADPDGWHDVCLYPHGDEGPSSIGRAEARAYIQKRADEGSEYHQRVVAELVRMRLLCLPQ